jgi:coenzyme F420-reducing hydrogenase alpha subunit
MALSDKDEYGYYSGELKILNPDGSIKIIKAENFTKNIKEIEEPYRAAKSARLDGRPFMVGALSRVNINHDQLHHLAKGILRGWKWKFPQYNPFYNIWAQAVEIVHFVEEAKKLLDDLAKNLKAEPSQGKKLKLISGANPLGRDTFGADAVEAPRGTLYHAYDINKDGVIKNCQIITPTVSFLKNLEEDIAAYIPELSKLSAEKRRRKIRALIRAYDPCISCATH